jgi:hypothetical protein
MTHDDFYSALSAVLPNKNAIKNIPKRIVQKQAQITVSQALTYLRLVQKEVEQGTENTVWEKFDNNSQYLIRRDCALMLDLAFNPFNRIKIDLLGNKIAPR